MPKLGQPFLATDLSETSGVPREVLDRTSESLNRPSTFVPDLLSPGVTLRDYTVDALLGRGGFGATYRVCRGEEVFALKEYLPAEFGRRQPDGTVGPREDAESAYQWGLQRFVDEARVLSSVDHANVVRIEEAWEARGTAYIAMEYLSGESLRTAFSRGVRWSESDALAFLEVVCSALAAVHGCDIVHRDVTPANVVRRADGSLVLIDFGSARLALGDRSRTVTSLVTAPYAPIEQYSGRAVHGPYTDVYAVAVIAYQGLTGDRPPDAATRAQDPSSRELVSKIASVAPGLVFALSSALEVYPDARPQTVDAWRGMFQSPASVSVGQGPSRRSVPPPSTGRFSAPQPAPAGGQPSNDLFLAGAAISGLSFLITLFAAISQLGFGGFVLLALFFSVGIYLMNQSS